MIRMIQSDSADHAKAYYTDALQKSDYYIEGMDGQELPGQFHGLLAERLGIKGEVTREAFFALCENLSPITGEQLTPRMTENRRVGYDINFHCPKSVSIVDALSKDDHIKIAFRESVLETMREIEKDMMVRVRKNGAFTDRNSGEMLFAEFTHLTARPTEGSTGDCHLHLHAFAINCAFDPIEKKFKAGEFSNIKMNMPYFQARYHKRLSDKLIELGYNIRKTKKSFEIDGVPQGVIDLFSKRSNEIGQFAKEQGITDAKTLDSLGARTRAKKQKGLTIEELKQDWRRQISEFKDYKEGEKDRKIRYAEPVLEKSPLKTIDCINHAKTHVFERSSVIAERRILEHAYRHSIGKRSISMDDVDANFNADVDILRVNDGRQVKCTTKEVLQEEKYMIELARKGQGQFVPLYPSAPELNAQGQQAAAIEHVLTTRDQVSIIMGAAGSGKTTLMKEAIALIEQTGKRVTTVAPTAQAARGVLVDEGFEHSETIAKLLTDKEMQKSLQDQVLWVDEPGLLGTKDMISILEIADRHNTRVVLGGDTRQHSAVLRGDALRILNTVGGIKASEVSKIYRQRDTLYRDAVQDLSVGNVQKAFIKLDQMEAIKEINRLKPNEIIVDDYVKALKSGRSALIVSPTNEQGQNVSKEVRKKLRNAGLIGKTENTVTKYSNLNLTEAQKADWRNFAEGDIIQFTQNMKGIKKASIWSVDNIQQKKITLKDKEGLSCELPLHLAKDFNVYHKTELAISKGDKIKITQNCYDQQGKRVNNGQSLIVKTVKQRDKTILFNPVNDREFIFDKDFGHIDHNYVTTSHSSQGKTVDEVFISQPSSTFVATDAKQFYVSVSRGRDNVKIYTDDKNELLEHATRIGDRQSAVELTDLTNDPNLIAVRHSKEKRLSKTITVKRNQEKSHNNLKIEAYEPEF